MMSTTIFLLIPIVIVIMLLAYFAINTSAKLYNRVIITTLMAIGLSISFVSYNTLLSQPKPANFEWIKRNATNVEVISMTMIKGEAIYLWMRFRDDPEPKYYVFGWSNKLAERLQKAMRQKQRSRGRGKIILKRPFRDIDGIAEDKDIINFTPLERQLPLKDYEK